MKREHLNESSWTVLFCGAVYYTAQGGCNFEAVDGIIEGKLVSSTSLWCCLYVLQVRSTF